ncbi:HYR domain-containing protein [Lysobacter terrae]
MTRQWTLAKRVGPGILVFALLALPTAVQAACATPEAKINPASLTMPDFVPVAGGGWAINTVTVNGQPSKPNANQGGLFQWTFIGTPAGTLTNANTPQVQFTPPDVTTSTQVTLRLTVTVTGCPGSDSEDIPITITNAHDVVVNAPPHAVPSASPASATEGMLVTLDGSASWDPDNTTLSYTWQQIAGPSVTLTATANPAIKTFVAPDLAANTLLSFRLTVSDGSLSNSDVAHVNVTWTNNPPVAALSCPDGGFELNEGQAHSFDASASSDSDDGIASYAWEQLVGFPEVPGVASWNTPVVNFNAPQLGFGQDGYIPFKLTVTDHAGAKSTAECAIFIHDITRPVISVPSDIQAEATSAAGANVGADEGYAVSALDNVDGNLPLVNYSEYFLCEPPPGALFALDATTPVLCRAWDSAGNEGTAGFSVHVVDTTAPVIDVPLSFAVEATGPDGAAAPYEATSQDAVDGHKDADCQPAAGSVFPIASPGPTTTVNCNATDAHGNAAEQRSFTIAIHDTTPPAFDAQSVSPNLQAEATSPAGAPVDFALPTANDLVDLGNVTVSCTPAAQSVFPLGETSVLCDAVDSRGNSAQDKGLGVGFKVTVVDTTPPALSGVPGDQTLEATSAAGAPFSYPTPTASDIVDGNRPVTCTAAPLPLTPGVFPLGVTTVTCAASDTRGNDASSSFTVTVQDTTPPTLDLPANIVAEATGPSGAAVPFSASASDLVDADVTVSCLPNSGSTFALGTTTVNCTGTDDAGNSASGSFSVTVRDTTPPTIASHGNVNATATGNSSAAVTYTAPTASDLVDGTVPVTCTPASGSSFAVGSTTVNCSAHDSRGNTASSSFAVIVNYAFNGFFQPIDNAPALNSVKAGSAVPVKFSLGGNQGLNIFAATPASGVIACGATEGDAIEETVTAGASSLQFDAATGQYIYVWKTEKSWVGQCRILQIKLKDGASKTALFKFK